MPTIEEEIFRYTFEIQGQQAIDDVIRQQGEVRQKVDDLKAAWLAGKVGGDQYAEQVREIARSSTDLARQLDGLKNVQRDQAAAQAEAARVAAEAAQMVAQSTQMEAEAQRMAARDATNLARQHNILTAAAAELATEERLAAQATTVLNTSMVRAQGGAEAAGKAFGGRGGGMGMAIMQVGYAVDDMQYGLRGVINNVPMLVSSLGLGMGVAGVAQVAAVGLGFLTEHMAELGGYATLLESQLTGGETFKVPTEGLSGMNEELKKARDRMEELQKQATLTAGDLRIYNDLRTKTAEIEERIKEAQAEKSLFEGLGNLKSKESREYESAFRTALPEAGGRDEVLEGLRIAIQREGEKKGYTLTDEQIEASAREIFLGAAEGSKAYFAQLRTLLDTYLPKSTQARDAFRDVDPRVKKLVERDDARFEASLQVADAEKREQDQRRKFLENMAGGAFERAGREIKEAGATTERETKVERRDTHQDESARERAAAGFARQYGGAFGPQQEALARMTAMGRDPDQFRGQLARVIEARLRRFGDVTETAMDRTVEMIVEKLIDGARAAAAKGIGGGAGAMGPAAQGIVDDVAGQLGEQVNRARPRAGPRAARGGARSAQIPPFVMAPELPMTGEFPEPMMGDFGMGDFGAMMPDELAMMQMGAFGQAPVAAAGPNLGAAFRRRQELQRRRAANSRSRTERIQGPRRRREAEARARRQVRLDAMNPAERRAVLEGGLGGLQAGLAGLLGSGEDGPDREMSPEQRAALDQAESFGQQQAARDRQARRGMGAVPGVSAIDRVQAAGAAFAQGAAERRRNAGLRAGAGLVPGPGPGAAEALDRGTAIQEQMVGAMREFAANISNVEQRQAAIWKALGSLRGDRDRNRVERPTLLGMGM